MNEKFKTLFCILISIIVICSCNKNNISSDKKLKNIEEEAIDTSINTHNEENNFSISVVNSQDGLISDNIIDILFKGNDIFCLSDKGIIKMSKNTGKIINFTFLDKVIHLNAIKDIDNIIYIIDKNSIYQFTDNKLSFINKVPKVVPDIIEIDDQVCLFNSDGFFYNIETTHTNLNIIQHYSNINIQYSYQTGKEIILTDRKNIYKMNIKDYSLTNIYHTDININYLLKENDKIYFGDKELFEYDSSIKCLNKIITLKSNNVLTYLFKDKNNLYIGKNKGITLLNLITTNTSEILENYAVKGSYINFITKDENTIWIGTRNNGLIKYIQNKIEL